jgi:hypothetical protein
MSPSNDRRGAPSPQPLRNPSGARDASAEGMLSNALTDLMLPGVVVELDAAAAEALGAFEETALTEAEAWEANADLGTSEVSHGD